MVWRHRLRWIFINYKPPTARQDPNRRGDDSKKPVGANPLPSPFGTKGDASKRSEIAGVCPYQPNNQHPSQSIIPIQPIPVQKPNKQPKPANTRRPTRHASNQSPSIKSQESQFRQHASNQSPSFQSRPSQFKIPPKQPKPANQQQAIPTRPTTHQTLTIALYHFKSKPINQITRITVQTTRLKSKSIIPIMPIPVQSPTLR